MDICLFTCVVVKAIHLENVAGLTTNEFFMALKSFIARHGKQMKSSRKMQLFKFFKSTIEIAWEKILKDRTVQSYITER